MIENIDPVHLLRTPYLTTTEYKLLAVYCVKMGLQKYGNVHAVFPQYN